MALVSAWGAVPARDFGEYTCSVVLLIIIWFGGVMTSPRVGRLVDKFTFRDFIS